MIYATSDAIWVTSPRLHTLRSGAADKLMSLDDHKMWKVIQGVWVEMLCFSASRYRGYLHAKALGTGGELLSYVWLLMSHMGMETLPERMQREVPVPVEPMSTSVKSTFSASSIDFSLLSNLCILVGCLVRCHGSQSQVQDKFSNR
jgi:hypothetical protein